MGIWSWFFGVVSLHQIIVVDVSKDLFPSSKISMMGQQAVSDGWRVPANYQLTRLDGSDLSWYLDRNKLQHQI
jgi:hypothetical protein